MESRFISWNSFFKIDHKNRNMGEDDYESPAVSVLESAEASFPAPEELRNSHTSRSSRSIWKGASSSRNGGTVTSTTLTDRKNNKNVCRLYALLAAVVVLVFFVIIPAVVVSKNKNNKSLQDRPRPTFDEIAEYIIDQGISTVSDVWGPETPQYQAAMWLMQDDPANVPVPTTSDISTYDGYRYMTRYVMAVNYFAFNGSNWDDDLNWMTDLDVCDWNDQFLINNRYRDIGLVCLKIAEEEEDGTVTIKRYPNELNLSMCVPRCMYVLTVHSLSASDAFVFYF